MARCFRFELALSLILIVVSKRFRHLQCLPVQPLHVRNLCLSFENGNLLLEFLDQLGLEVVFGLELSDQSETLSSRFFLNFEKFHELCTLAK